MGAESYHKVSQFPNTGKFNIFSFGSKLEFPASCKPANSSFRGVRFCSQILFSTSIMTPLIHLALKYISQPSVASHSG